MAKKKDENPTDVSDLDIVSPGMIQLVSGNQNIYLLCSCSFYHWC